MKKVLLLSLLLPISFISSQVQAINPFKIVGGITAGLVSAGSAVVAYDLVAKRAKPGAAAPGLGAVVGVMAAGAGLLSIGSGMVSAALLTDLPSVAIGKLGLGASSGALFAISAPKAIKAALNLRKDPNHSTYKSEAQKFGLLAVLTGVVASVAVYSAIK